MNANLARCYAALSVIASVLEDEHFALSFTFSRNYMHDGNVRRVPMLVASKGGWEFDVNIQPDDTLEAYLHDSAIDPSEQVYTIPVKSDKDIEYAGTRMLIQFKNWLYLSL